MAIKDLDTAKRNKAEEFHTQLDRINAEMQQYRAGIKGKTTFFSGDEPF